MSVDTEQDVIVTRPFQGLCHMQVCAKTDLDPKEVEASANRQNPSGTSNGWHIVTAENASEHETDPPVQCGDDPSRTHYLLVC